MLTSQFHKFYGDLKHLLKGFHEWNIVLVIKFVLNKIILTWHSIKLNIKLFFVAFLN